MRKSLLFKILGLLIFGISTVRVQAEANSVPMADGLRAEGKIYVVVISLLLILVGVFGFLFWLERRMKEIEELSSK